MPLAYGRRRRRGRRLVGWGLLVTLLAAGGLAHHWRGRWLPPVRHRWDLYQLTRSQARCLAFTPPPGQVVFTDAADAAVGPDAGRITSDGYTAVLWRPPVWRDFLDRARVEDPYTETFASWFAPSMPVPPAADLLFCPCLLHERQLPNGDRVLACVTVSVTHTSANLNGFYWLPGSSTSPPRHMPAETIEIAKANSADALTIEAARLDPADPTRFDIPYRVGDRSGVVHGRMDRGGVTFEPDAGWWVPGEGIWTTDGTGVRLHQRTTPDYVLPYPPGVARVMPDVRPAQLAFTADGRRLLAVLAEPKPTRVVVWDLATRKLCGEVGLNTEGRPADTAYIRVDPVLSPDGRLCVSVVNGYTGGAGPTRYFSFIRGIDVSTGREVGQTPVRPSATRPVGFSPDGQSIYFGSGGRLWLVNTTSWAERASTVLHGELGEAAVGPSHVAVMTGPVEAYGYVRADRLTIFGADLLAVACPPTPPIYNFTFAPRRPPTVHLRLRARSARLGCPAGRALHHRRGDRHQSSTFEGRPLRARLRLPAGRIDVLARRPVVGGLREPR